MGFIDSNIFWMLFGILFVLICFAFKAIVEDRGWPMTWWKWALSIIWYGIFGIAFYSYGTLAGENEASAGLKLMLFTLFVAAILGVGLWRVLMIGAEESKNA